MYTHYDLFLFSGQTLNALPFAVGGFCSKGTAHKCCKKLNTITFQLFPQIADPVLVDIHFRKLLLQAVLPDAIYIAASISSPIPKEPCGGVCGKWSDDNIDAADGILRYTEEGLYEFAIPGTCACIMAVDAKHAQQAYQWAIQTTRYSIWKRETITLFLNELSHYNGQFLFSTDGSAGQAGCVSVIEDHTIKIAWLANSGT